MININVEVKGEKIVISGLEGFEEGIGRRAIPRGLRKIASGTAREALKNLTGARRGLKTVESKKGRQRAVPQRPELAGGYPVPRVAGHLRRMLGWLGPNRTKSYEGLAFSTGPDEAVIFNAAFYASQIHEGLGSSEKYGARPFIEDAFETFNGANNVTATLEEEIIKEKIKSGLG